ncbi:MAG TPA: glycoside hydrolase 43 family protein [Pyrinomonadaceae bacterium]|nr:glycoside hydrolase 43 family protein [Pyrinomonadaceae bacterium]
MATETSFNPLPIIILTAALLLDPLCYVVVAQRTDQTTSLREPRISRVWVSDNQNGTYRNPIIHADYSDPDAIRVGDDFYMTASSFNAVPGLPILHSKDLVNWKIIGHALARLPPFEVFAKPQHGNGVWAPAIRFHRGEFYIYYPDPDFGIYLVKAKHPSGPWSEPLLVKQAKGWIDPCPLWDAEGNAYLVSAMAASRSGIKSILIVSRMSPDGERLLDDGVIVFDGHEKHPTVEGPKFYQRNGYFYIFAPAGGVATGWQLVLRSKSVYGPYEERVVLAQGKTRVNGPHQGAWVETQTGESWFIHFQDKGPFGRVVHLQPMKWINDWPAIGHDPNGDGTGEPVSSCKKPNVGRNESAISTPPESDEFNTNLLGLQWQWHANRQPNWMFPTNLGFIRLFNVPLPEGHKNFWDVPNLLLQKFPAPEFTATTKVTFTPRTDDEEAGLIVMGLDYAYVSVKKKPAGLFVSQTVVKDAERGELGKESVAMPLKDATFYLRVKVTQDGVCNFSYNVDGTSFAPVGQSFRARQGKWIGAKLGLFAVSVGKTRENGYADFDWFRIEP